MKAWKQTTRSLTAKTPSCCHSFFHILSSLLFLPGSWMGSNGAIVPGPCCKFKCSWDETATTAEREGKTPNPPPWGPTVGGGTLTPPSWVLIVELWSDVTDGNIACPPCALLRAFCIVSVVLPDLLFGASPTILSICPPCPIISLDPGVGVFCVNWPIWANCEDVPIWPVCELIMFPEVCANWPPWKCKPEKLPTCGLEGSPADGVSWLPCKGNMELLSICGLEVSPGNWAAELIAAMLDGPVHEADDDGHDAPELCTWSGLCIPWLDIDTDVPCVPERLCFALCHDWGCNKLLLFPLTLGRTADVPSENDMQVISRQIRVKNASKTPFQLLAYGGIKQC